MTKFTMCAGVAMMALASPAPAQSSTPSSDAPADRTTRNRDDGRDIVVTGPLRQSETDVLQGTSVLKGEALTRALRPTIGDTLARLPGVSATSFGPSASRPVLRGFQGERIRVLTDGIGSIDVSNTSVDHAVVIDPLLAERIEVLRGPAALLYGSSAVGGVVNVIDKRIPSSVPAKGYRIDAIANYGSAANERSGEAAADVALDPHFVVHVDGSYAKAGDVHIGGYALTPLRRQQALVASLLPQNPADEPIDFAASARIQGMLPNLFNTTYTAGVGASLITDTGQLGISYGHYDGFYGVPVRYATAVGQGQEAPRLSVVQNRVDLRGEVQTGGGFLEKIRIRAGHADYRHFELQEDGSIGTAFFNNGTEGRVELVQAKRGGWQGASGVQVFNRIFNVVGDEAFLPKNETNQVGLFTLQQFEAGAFKAEGGVRYEHTDVSARTPQGDLRFFAGQRTYSAVSGSVGGSYGLGGDVRIGVNLSHTERAPSAEELFANGAHAGTQAYELGNPNFVLERSNGAELTVRAHGNGYSFDAAAYYNRFTHYISENQTDQAVCAAAAAQSGRDVDLPCFQSIQGDAEYYGVEGEGSVEFGRLGGFRLNADVLGDYVHASLVDRGPLPRIPPMRVLGGVEAQGDRFNGRVEVEHVFDQTRVAAFETPTADYTEVNASLGFNPFGGGNRTSLLLSANNIFDADARRHASFLKDFAPLAGRDIRVTVKVGL